MKFLNKLIDYINPHKNLEIWLPYISNMFNTPKYNLPSKYNMNYSEEITEVKPKFIRIHNTIINTDEILSINKIYWEDNNGELKANIVIKSKIVGIPDITVYSARLYNVDQVFEKAIVDLGVTE